MQNKQKSRVSLLESWVTVPTFGVSGFGYHGYGHFWNHEHKSMQNLQFLQKSNFSRSKMAEGAKKKYALVQQNCILFYLIMVWSKTNQAPFEIFRLCDFANLVITVMTSKERFNLYKIYAWIMHRWIANCWIV